MILKFEDKNECINYLDKKDIVTIDSGTEGICYLGSDSLAYKIIYHPMFNYEIDKIITKDMFDLKHFAFPIDIYTNNDMTNIYGYSCEFLNNNLFDQKNMEKLLEIDVDILKEEYFDMVKDIEVLSKNDIFMFDLEYNVLFNNDKLLAIDTLGYKKDSNALLKNKDLLLKSIISYYGINMQLYNCFGFSRSIDEFCDTYKRVIKR